MSDTPLGRSCWYELMTTDPDAAQAFYGQIAAWGTAPFDDGPEEMPVSAWIFYIRVPDVNEAVDKVKELGGTVLTGPMEVPGGDWIAHCMDPQGAAFAVNSTAQA